MKYKIYMQTKKSWDPFHEVNEDSYMFTEYSFMEDKKIRVMVVADGMGGYEDGEKASANAVQGFLKAFYEKMLDMYMNHGNVEKFSATYFADRMIDLIKEAICAANREVCEKAERFKKTGTTLSVVCVLEGYAVVANVGDSPVYFYRSNEDCFKLVSTLQTQAEKEVEEGRYERYSPEYYANEHRIYNCIGLYEELDKQKICSYVIGQLEKGDMFLAGSDGAFGRMRDEEIKELLTNCSEDERDFVLTRLFSEARIDKYDDQTAFLYVITEE